MNAARTANIFYYVVHIDYIQYIGGLKPIGEGVIFICLHLQQLLVGYEPRHHRRDGHHLWGTTVFLCGTIHMVTFFDSKLLF